MMNYIEYLNLPAKIVVAIVAVLLAMNLIGELLEFRGKIVPEIFKLRKVIARKKKEREVISKLSDTMEIVNKRLERDDQLILELNKKIDKNSDDILHLILDNKRNTIIRFAEHVANDNALATREQFDRSFKIYAEYERMIEENGLTNHEVDIAHRIIDEAYEDRLKTHSFIEDMRGYPVRER